MENAQILKFKGDIWVDFPTLGLHDDLGLFSFPHKYLTNEAISSTFVQLIPKGRRSIL